MKTSKKDKQILTLADICKDFDQWPDSWAGGPEDILPGERIVSVFKLFLQAQIEKGRARSTLRKHADYLWALGGEIIRDVSVYDHNRDLEACELVLKYISDDGGPLWRHAYDDKDHMRYDSVCRSLSKFLDQV